MLDNSILTPKRAIYNLLGALCNKPQLILDEKISTLEKEDFYESFYKSMFVAINNIVISNAEVKSISAVDIDNYLAPSTSAYKIFTDNELIDLR